MSNNILHHFAAAAKKQAKADEAGEDQCAPAPVVAALLPPVALPNPTASGEPTNIRFPDKANPR